MGKRLSARRNGVKIGEIPEKVFQQILALGEAWRVVHMDYQEKESKVLIRVEETSGTPGELVASGSC